MTALLLEWRDADGVRSQVGIWPVCTMCTWMREHLVSLEGAPAEYRPPGRPARLEADRAVAREVVSAVTDRLGWRVGEATVFHELGGAVPLRLVRECLAELKREHRARARRAREDARTHTVVHARGAIWSLDATHLGHDDDATKLIGEIARDVASSSTLGASIGPPLTSAEVAALLERTVQQTGECPLVLATDNGPENQGEVEAWCKRRGVVHLWNLPHTPQHNPWIEHGNAEIKAETGLGKGVRIACVSAVVRAVVRALHRIRTEPQSALAPLMGPWAGRLYGHSDCTMATALPGWSATAAVLLAAGMVSLAASARWRARLVALAAPTTGLLLWCGLALMSVVNSLE